MRDEGRQTQIDWKVVVDFFRQFHEDPTELDLVFRLIEALFLFLSA